MMVNACLGEAFACSISARLLLLLLLLLTLRDCRLSQHAFPHSVENIGTQRRLRYMVPARTYVHILE